MTRPPGRPLDPARDAAILHAAIDGLIEVGYDRLSMEDIAARARAGKGALYRRWPSKAALVTDAVLMWRAERAPTTAPDTGSLVGDIDALVAAIPDFGEAARKQNAIMMGLVTASQHDPELKKALTDNVLELPRRILRDVLDRAVSRGEIPPDRDLGLVPEIVIGFNLLAALLGEGVDTASVRRLFETIVYPAVIGTTARP